MLGLLCGWLVAEIASGFLSCDLLVGVKMQCNASVSANLYHFSFPLSLFLLPSVLQSNPNTRLPSASRPGERGRHSRRYYQDRSQIAKQARSQAKQRFHELARLRNQNPVCMDKEEIKRVGSKLIVLMDYTATQEDELSIEFAEVLIADVLKQAGAERIWTFCPRLDKCGYVPISLVVPPVV